MPPSRKRYDSAKRALDLVGGSLCYLVSLPVQAVVAAVILMRLGRPVLFRQRRPGKDGRIFILVKFRSMRLVDTEKGVVADADRLSSFGRFLRSTSLDELPTLANVIKGEMSLVGPRPLLVEYLPRYSPEQARRHEVRPGITGLAQSSGRNGLHWEEKLALDVAYVDNRSIVLDARILLRTVGAVIRREGTSAAGHATMPAFSGHGSNEDPA